MNPHSVNFLSTLDHQIRSLIIGVQQRELKDPTTGKVYENVFAGSEVCDWLCQELKCTRGDALKYGEALTACGSMVPTNCTLFRDKLGAFYAFSETPLKPNDEVERTPEESGDEETKKLRDEIQKNFFMDSVDVLLAIFLPRSQQQQTPMKPSLARAGSIKAIYVSREILCISTDENTFYIHHLKETRDVQKSTATFSLIKRCQGEDLRRIEVDAERPNRMMLTWDTTYTFDTSSETSYERNLFLWLSEKLLKQTPQTSLDIIQLQMELQEEKGENFRSIVGLEDVDEFQELMTEEEEAIIEALTQRKSLHEVTSLAFELEKQSAELEKGIINHFISARTEKSSGNIRSSLVKAKNKMDVVDRYLTLWEKVLTNEQIRKDVLQIEERNKNLQIFTRNLTELLKALDNLLMTITIRDEYNECIDSPNFHYPLREKTIEAGRELERVLSACEEIQKTRPMIVVAQQQKKYGEKSKKFLEVFLHFMSNFLDSQHSNYMTKMQPPHPGRKTILTKYTYSISQIHKTDFKNAFKSVDKSIVWKLSEGQLGPALDESASELSESEDYPSASLVLTSGGKLGHKRAKSSRQMSAKQSFPFLLNLVLRKVELEEKFVQEFLGIQDDVFFFEALFDTLKDEFNVLIAKQSNTNPFLCISNEVQTIQKKKLFEGKSKYISKLLTDLQAANEAEFKKFMEETKSALEKTKLGATGISPITKKFVDVIKAIGKHGEEESVIAQKYIEILIRTFFAWINDSVTPKDQKLVARLENFKYFITKLEPVNQKTLTPYVTMAKEEYKNAMNLYVKDISSECFGSLYAFFEGVAKLYQTSPEQYDTIQCDTSYSNHKLASVLTKVSLNSVKKAMEGQYKKLVKLIGVETEQNLLPEVWKEFQEYIYETYKNWEMLIKLCYNTKHLPFTADDIKTCWSTMVAPDLSILSPRKK